MSRIDAALRDLRTLDALAARPSARTELDPRAHLLMTLAFIVTVASFDRYTVLALLPFALYPVLMAAWADVPLGLLARRIALAAPFALMLGLANPWLDRAPVAQLLGWPISGGWVSLASIGLRVALTVAAAVVLVAATGMTAVCAALAQLGVPRVFTTQLLLLHRYLGVLAEEAARMRLARELRAGLHRPLGLAVWGTLLGHLLVRSIDRAQRIHLAMLARGFDGGLPLGPARRWHWRDSAGLALCLAALALARHVDLVQLLGRTLARALA